MATAAQLSIVVIAQDEEQEIGSCIESALFADEIVVVDGGSTDRTVEVATAYPKVRLIQRPWEGYAPQWNFAIAQSTGNWVMTLSADEVVTTELAAELREAITADQHDAFRVSFNFVVFGQPLRFGIFRLHNELRCVRRSQLLGMSDDLVHEHLLAAPCARVLKLGGKVIHSTYASREEYRLKADRYTDLEAIELAAAIDSGGMHVAPFSLRAVIGVALPRRRDGRSLRERLRPLKNSRPSYLTWYLGPVVRFVVDYVICLGFMDGRTGLFLARSGAAYTYTRYAKAWALHGARERR